MSKGLFTVAGLSTDKGVTKVRFANDFVSRTKVLSKGTATMVELIELPRPMSKAEACQHLLDVGGVFSSFTTLITETMGKKVGTPVSKATPTLTKAAAKAPEAKVKQPKVKAPKIVVTQTEDDDLEIEELKQIAA
jgi:hypothetical protein